MFPVGASVVNPSDLKYLYESHENFVALPTYFILPGMCMESPIVAQSMPPGKHADFTNVSKQQRLERHYSDTRATYYNNSRVTYYSDSRATFL